ncbi:MAG: aldo/keto reductase [Selenomonadaceae bacterium]|nr:aldo/keto reductase [Selenomonadaceae bacterium]
MVKKFFTVIICAAFVNLFGACTAQKEVPQMTSESFFAESVALNSGYNMPIIGLGTWTLNDDEAEDCVYFALKVGYRLIDTARYYGNEVGVGRGIRRAIQDGIASREEIFVTSKIMPGNYNQPDSAIDASLKSLGLDYVDLMLIHQPGYNDEEVYRALERGVKAGKIRSIGISNYYTPRDFDRIKNIASIVPAVIQNENHLFYQNTELQAYVKKFGTVVEAWYPFGGRGNTQKIFGNEIVQSLAKKYSKSPAQIVLRWQIQSGYIAIPGSSNKNHIAENFNVFDFRLSVEDMKLLRGLNKGQRFENW